MTFLVLIKGFFFVSSSEVLNFKQNLFVCNRGDTIHIRRSPIKGVRPNPYATGVPSSKAGIIISPVSTDGLTVFATGKSYYALLAYSVYLKFNAMFLIK